MNRETSPTAANPPVTDPIDPIAPDRRKALEQLYIENYSSLRDVADTAGASLLIGDLESLTNSVASRLDDYPGPEDDADAFLEWAASLIQPAAARLEAFYSIQRECSPFVYHAIWKVLVTCLDLGVTEQTPDEIAANVWMWAITHLDALQTLGTAKITTRLSARAYWTARAWKTTQLRARAKFAPWDDLTKDGSGVVHAIRLPEDAHAVSAVSAA